MEVIFIYLCTVALSFWLLQSDFRRVADVSISDIVAMSLVSVLPIVNLPTSLLCWIVGMNNGPLDKTVWRKK